MSDYDIRKAFEEIENELIDSMMRNFSRHRAEEEKEGYNWSQWQAEQLKSLEEYRKNNAEKFGKQFSNINSKVEEMIRTARADGNAEQEANILQAVKDGFKLPEKSSKTPTAEFFKINDRKLDVLIKSTTNDLKSAETAVLRMSNDKYRKAIFNAQVYANTGAGTYEKAVDMACKDMLNAGLNCVEYKNGARHTLSDYAEMAIRTANKRAYLRGEGEKRQAFGITTVVVNSRQGGCPKCAKYIGKVFIDDVYSGGTQADGKYPLLSNAIAGGLFHPRCKDSTSTYYEGITTLSPVTAEEMAEMDRREQLEAQQQYAERQTQRFDRRAKYSLDEDNKRIAQTRADYWRDKALKLGDIKNAETLVKQADVDGTPMTPEKVTDLRNRLGRIGVRNVNNVEKLKTPEVIEIFVKQLEKLNQDYGKMFFRLDVTDLPDGDIAQVTPAKILQLNKKYLNSSAEMDAIIKKFIKDKLLPKGADINYIVTHEWGHFISMEDLQNPKSPIHTYFGRTKAKDFVSKNARLNIYEYTADTIACYINKISCKNAQKVIDYYLKGR